VHGIKRGHPLTPFGIGETDYRDFVDAWYGRDDVLDLAGVDVVATGDDHVALPVDQVEIPVLIQPPEVPGMQGAVCDRLNLGGVRGGLPPAF
jgi:hypothetical protein